MLLVCNIRKFRWEISLNNPCPYWRLYCNANAGDIYPGDFTVPGLIIKRRMKYSSGIITLKRFPVLLLSATAILRGVAGVTVFTTAELHAAVAAVAESGTLPLLRSATGLLFQRGGGGGRFFHQRGFC